MSYEEGSHGTLGVSNGLTTSLVELLLADDIQPGSSPSYQTCKNIYAYHPLGAKMAEEPISLAQSQEREIKIAGAPEEDLIEAFHVEWNGIGKAGATQIIHNTMKTSRIYGVSSVVIGAVGVPTSEPLDKKDLYKKDLFFNVLDPLNTAGSLVLNQDPNSQEYQKPTYLVTGGQKYHSSRSVVIMNEEPVYIEWTTSAFGFVGRSVYQRALYPLKSFIKSMLTDDSVVEKAGLLVAKLKSPGSAIDNRTKSFFGFKREAIKGAKTGNVVSIGTDESIESIDLTNLNAPLELTRNNILKNTATAARMPASMLNQETLAEGFGEGTEDAKNIARYIDGVRMEMDTLYKFFDEIVMYRAWNPEFYKSIQRKYPAEYGKVPYETAFYQWKNSFKAKWPNLLTEPDSEKVKTDDVILKGAIGFFEVLAPQLDPENKALLCGWMQDVVNNRKFMNGSHLNLDLEAIAQFTPPEPESEPSTREAYDG